MKIATRAGVYKRAFRNVDPEDRHAAAGCVRNGQSSNRREQCRLNRVVTNLAREILYFIQLLDWNADDFAVLRLDTQHTNAATRITECGQLVRKVAAGRSSYMSPRGTNFR